MQLSRHATDKLEAYGITSERLLSWEGAVEQGSRLVYLSTGASIVVTEWEQRPWIAVLSQDGDRVITTYPTDHGTLTKRIGAGQSVRFKDSRLNSPPWSDSWTPIAAPYFFVIPPYAVAPTWHSKEMVTLLNSSDPLCSV
jgi:hypothetical protein